MVAKAPQRHDELFRGLRPPTAAFTGAVVRPGRDVTTETVGSPPGSTPLGSSRSSTRIVPPTLSSEMSTSMCVGIWSGRVRTSIGEHLLVDFPVGVAHFDRVADDVQRHFDDDRLVGVDDLEVHVGHGAAHRVTLDVTGHDEELLAVGVEFDQGVDALLAGDGGAKGLGLDRDRQRLDALAVDDGRDRAGRRAGDGRCASPSRGWRSRSKWRVTSKLLLSGWRKGGAHRKYSLARHERDRLQG